MTATIKKGKREKREKKNMVGCRLSHFFAAGFIGRMFFWQHKQQLKQRCSVGFRREKFNGNHPLAYGGTTEPREAFQ
jgi:hypothetical protein